MKVVNINGEFFSYLLNNLRNFNKIFRKNVTDGNIKIPQKI